MILHYLQEIATKDENVFDIRQGTAISLMIKKKGAKGCNVVHRDIYGDREEKYKWLDKHAFKKKDFTSVKPSTPWYVLKNFDIQNIKHFEKWPTITQIFPLNSTGIKTHRDDFVIDFKPTELLNCRTRTGRRVYPIQCFCARRRRYAGNQKGASQFSKIREYSPIN